MLETEFETRPAGGQTGSGDRPGVGEADTAKAEDHCLPQPTRRGGVDPVRRVAPHIFQVHQRRPHKVFVGFFWVAQVAGQDGVNRRPQGRAVGVVRAWGVVVPVDPQRLMVVVIAQQIEEHQHVGLLDHLPPVDGLVPQNGLHRLGARFVVGQVHVFQLEKALELFDQPALRVVGDQDTADDVGPATQPVRGQVELTFQLGRPVGVFSTQPGQGLQRRLQMPSDHPVGEGVVVHVFVIFVGADDIGDLVAAPFGVPLDAAVPKAGGVQDDFGSVAAHPVVVARGPPVAPDGVGHVGADVELDVAAPDAN